MKRSLCLSLCLSVLPSVASAHPHIFVEAQVALVFDGSGAMAGVRLTWTYDDFFSLLLTEDLGLDPDGDMVLRADEVAVLQGAVLDWPADFGGDLEVTQGGAPLALGAARDKVAVLVEGRVRESHFRPLAAPVTATAPVNVQVFDPFYYVAYEVVAPITVEGRADCATQLRKADLNSAYALVDELLYGRPAGDVGPDEAFPEVGAAFADTVTVTCGG
ncbi:MAG: DUF1007 family protein [Rhodobacterales bacterium]|nr:DUF1007 family protein [Rhodobacterales bacterium]NCT12708.1 DUF1007 family protein [Rhodobacterales bacterium]